MDVKQGYPLGQTTFSFAMHAFLVPLEKTMPADAKPRYRTSTRKEGQRGDNVSGTNVTNLGEFEFSF